ncbi:uncharacterized protein LOC128984862 [Macrosteles quadrilineatus]|uniref:uncharacterized protein LOC128984862 n=1 Tax=Macrosteles quadrilineatus TaxID=74068 RepID=UPI0023E1E35A|nr:uncharacterized protein LOC128984862 [Macrosteles quadrilineatus]
MDSQGNKSVKGFTEQFRSIYPNVSIQTLGDKGTQSVEKRTPVRTPQKTVTAATGPKTPGVNVKTPAVVYKQIVTTPKTQVTNLNVKQGTLTPRVSTPTQAKPPVAAKPQAVTKTLVTPKTPTQVTKGNVAVAKTPVPTPQAVKTAAVKSPAVKTPSATKTVQQKVVPVKQQTPVVAKVSANLTASVAKDNAPDQSTATLVTYHIPHRTSKQLTIEKVDQQQRIPVVLDTNQLVLKSGQLVLQNRVTPVDTSQVQSVVIGTSALPTAAVVTPQAEITTSEPLQSTLQVSQQVTLYGPKGKPFAVDDVKKQINLNKQAVSNTMTNVVSSTTNPVPVAATVPTQSVQSEQQKKAAVSARTQETRQSPVRVSQRVSGSFRAQQKVLPSTASPQYPSTLGQIKKVSPKREIPMQKVSPLPPSLPPPEMELANEEEVTTSEELPAQRTEVGNYHMVIYLPSGEKKDINVSAESVSLPLNEILSSALGVPTEPNSTAVVQQIYQEDVEGAQWSSNENTGAEPGEILGLQDEMEPGDMNEETPEQSVDEADDSPKELASRSEPLYKDGLLAVCHFCGYTSVDFNQCQRCNRKIPPDCKTIPTDFTQSVALTQVVVQTTQTGRKTKADSLSGGESPKKKRICRNKKKPEEPVCLTISDDEELLGLHHHHNEESFHSDSNSQMSSCDKEPIITDEMVTELKESISAGEFVGGGLDLEELLDGCSEQRTFLQCRTVRVGSYKVVPKDRVTITPYGIKFTIPAIGTTNKYVDVKILHHEIIKVLISFNRSMPVLFFYTRPAAAVRIRKLLLMTDKTKFYYDCMSSDETHRRITFLPEKIDEECKSTLKDIYSNPDSPVLAELTGKEANAILVKASPKEVVMSFNFNIKNNLVEAFIVKKNPLPPQQQTPFNGQNIKIIMVYPPPPEKGGISINTEDYACLDCEQFLNDVIIDFYLKYIVEKTLSPEDRARTHVFSSFFYKRLTTKPPPKRKSMNPVENDPTASPAVKRHSRVKNWTKNVNLFAKDFIIIPINENSHWFLAIVCFPGLTGRVRFDDNTPIDPPNKKKKKEEEKASLTGKQSVTIGSTTITAVTPTPGTATLDLGDEVEDRDEADGENEKMDVPDEDEIARHLLEHKRATEVKEEPEEEEEVRKPKKNERIPVKQPCILIFDSLAGTPRSRVVATLRDYLRVEYETKHGETRDFSGDVLKGTNVKCPQQTNYTDCGLYVLQYVEAFFQCPITDFHIPILQVQDWFQADIVTRKRYDIQQLLLHLMQEQRIDIEALNLPVLNLSPDMGMNYANSEEEDDDDEDYDHMGDEDDEDEDRLDEDGDYNEEMMDHEEMEEGEITIGHHEEDEPDYLDPAMEHEEHELDEEDYDEQMCEEEEEQCMDEMDDVPLSPVEAIKAKDLKKYRIPRLAEKDRSSDSV